VKAFSNYTPGGLKGWCRVPKKGPCFNRRNVISYVENDFNSYRELTSAKFDDIRTWRGHIKFKTSKSHSLTEPIRGFKGVIAKIMKGSWKAEDRLRLLSTDLLRNDL
jgi:hypothetical protein